MGKLAVIDIGTNSIHMMLAEVRPTATYHILDRVKDMTRLGDGTFASGRLSELAMARGVEVLRNFTRLAHHKGCARIVATATSAVREAANGGEFLRAILRAAGVRVRVLTGQEEARLIYVGVRHHVALPEGLSVIVDVGGGSVEVIASEKGQMRLGTSLKLGAIRLKDAYLGTDPPTKAQLAGLRATVTQELGAALQPVKNTPCAALVATSGMAANLAEIIHLQRTGRPLDQVNLTSVTLRDLRQVERRLSQRALAARLAIPGLDPKRVDTLLPAAVVLRRLMELTGQHQVTISDKAIREGLLVEYIERHRAGLRAEQDIPNVRKRHVVLLGRRCQFPEAHSTQVATLALSLFDQLQPLHGLGAREREWLEYAALLHDIGYLINVRQHHKHAYYLIKHAPLSPFTAEEIELIANVARYHRQALPHTGHAAFKALPERGRTTVEQLSALLRIADGLDRSHFGVVKEISVTVGPRVTVGLACHADAQFEIWAAANRVDLFERVFRRRVQFLIHDLQGRTA